MPNHVVNEIRLHSVHFADAREIVSSHDRPVDFEQLLPLPLNHWPGSVSILHEKAFPGTHLDDATKMWGTKWNAYGLSKDSLLKDREDTILTFETAWAPPRGWVVALFNTLKCDITHYWNDEGSDKVHRERYLFSGDNDITFPKWESEIVVAGSADYKRIYKMQWGVESPEELEMEMDQS